jgi:hypothetical protein
VALQQLVAEQFLDQCRQAHAFQTGQPRGQLGIEERSGRQPQFGQARQVLGCRVQHPFQRIEHRGQSGKVIQLGRIDEHRAGAFSTELYEVRALPVAIPRGAFGVHG